MGLTDAVGVLWEPRGSIPACTRKVRLSGIPPWGNFMWRSWYEGWIKSLSGGSLFEVISTKGNRIRKELKGWGEMCVKGEQERRQWYIKGQMGNIWAISTKGGVRILYSHPFFVSCQKEIATVVSDGKGLYMEIRCPSGNPAPVCYNTPLLCWF